MHWTEQHEAQLEEIMSKCREEGKSIKEAFEVAAEALGRSVSSIRNHYYLTRKSVAPADGLNGEDSKETGNTDTNEKIVAGEVALQKAGVHVIRDENDPLPPGTAPAVIARAELVDEPFIKVAVSPITKAQLDVMSESELFDLVMNVLIKIQEISNKKSDKLTASRREFHALNQEYQEVKDGYASLLNVINKAREMALKSDEKLLRPVFKMEKNGNLEPLRNG